MPRRHIGAPTMVSLSTRWRWVANFMPQSLYSQYALHRMLCGPHIWPGCFSEKRKILCPTVIQILDHQTRSLSLNFHFWPTFRMTHEITQKTILNVTFKDSENLCLSTPKFWQWKSVLVVRAHAKTTVTQSMWCRNNYKNWMTEVWATQSRYHYRTDSIHIILSVGWASYFDRNSFTIHFTWWLKYAQTFWTEQDQSTSLVDFW